MGNVLVNRLQQPEFVDLLLKEETDHRVPGLVVLKAFEADLPDRVWRHPAIVSSYVDIDDEPTWATQRDALGRMPFSPDSWGTDQILTLAVPLVDGRHVAFVPDDLVGPDDFAPAEDLQLFAYLGDTRGRLKLVQRRGRWAAPTFDSPLHCTVGRCATNQDCGCDTCCELCACVLVDVHGFDAMTCWCPEH